MSRIAFVDHRDANATQQIVTLVGMNVIAVLIAEAGQLEGDLVTVEPGAR